MMKTGFVLAFLVLTWTAQAVLVDDFEGYAAGDVDLVTGGAWVESPTRPSTGMTIAADADGNRVLGIANGGDGQTGVYGILQGDEVIGVGQTRTLFTRFYLSGVSGTYDVSFGLTGVNTPTSWSDFASYFTIVNGSFNVRQGGTNTTVANISAGRWYYVWLVVDYANYRHTCYLKDAAADATTADRVALNWGMRNTSGGTLDRLFGMTNSSAYRPVWFDNVHITDGVSLTLPADVPVPPVVLSQPTDAAAEAGQAAAFETVFESRSTPTVSWFKADSLGDVELEASDPDVAMGLTDLGGGAYQATLGLANLTVGDAGGYYCRIYTQGGQQSDSGSARLVVYGLTARWTFDAADYAEGRFIDAAGGHDARPAGTPAFVSGADGTAGGAVQITADSGWADVEAFDPTLGSGMMTLSLWANWQEAAAAEDLEMSEFPDGGSVLVEDGLRTDGRWRHLCIVYGGLTARIYMDGLFTAEGPWTLPADASAVLTIGSAPAGEEPFNGILDDLRIYNYAMSDTDVADLYYDMTGRSVCLLDYARAYDRSGPAGEPDCVVDLYDLAAFTSQWLVLWDFEDFSGFSGSWQSSGKYPR